MSLCHFAQEAFLRNDRSTSTSPTGESLGGSSRIPRIENHTRSSLRTDSTSPSRYLDNLSSRQKRGVSPVVIYDKNIKGKKDLVIEM